ncbi:MAG: hypothetical protein GY810_00555 [Aureispira sp.]|nr:hypothetical protein [Aureispira sp.]
MAKNNVYALFVGVDAYDRTSGISHLSGCVNDAKRMMAYLDENIDKDQYKFHTVTLFSERGKTDEKTFGAILPTRANILEQFNKHLINKVKKDDYAIFFYAGHGTTEPAHPYFNEPTGTVQALVPYDARVKKNGQEVRCILDKEIRFLIRKLWERSDNCENIIFIQDSCHSAGASRMAEAVKSINNAMNKAKEAGIEGVEAFEETSTNGDTSKDTSVTTTTDDDEINGYPKAIWDKLTGQEQATLKHGGSYDSLKLKAEGNDAVKELIEKVDALMKEHQDNVAEKESKVDYPQEVLEQLSASEQKELSFYKNGIQKGSDLDKKLEKLMAEYAENQKPQDENRDGEEELTVEAKPEARFLPPNGAGHIEWEEGDQAIKQIMSLYSGFDIKSRGGSNNSQQKEPFDVAFPQGNHLHMAACSSYQYAYEIKHTDPVTEKAYRGGVFTNTILSLLQKSKNNISYHDLFNRAKLSIDGVFKQTPDMYVKGDVSKRYSYFLGDAIQREITEISSDSYNVEYNTKEGWFIDAGEMQGLPRTEGNVSFIPVYVYELGEEETNLEDKTPNAYLSPVFAHKSMLYADENKVNEQGEPLLTLKEGTSYKAYISPKWHRRRRVRVAVDKPIITHDIANHLASQDRFTTVESLQEADYSIRTEKGSYFLFKIKNGQEELLSTFTAYYRTIKKIEYIGEKKGGAIKIPIAIAKKTTSITRKKTTVTNYFKKVAIKKILSDGTESLDEPTEGAFKEDTKDEKRRTVSYELAAGYCVRGTEVILKALLTDNDADLIKIKLYETEAKNPFKDFRIKNNAELDYYNTYINWIDKPEDNVGKIDYWIGYDGARYFVYADGDIDKQPIFKQTRDTNDTAAWEIIAALQHMTKWYTVAGFKNKIQTEVFKNRDLMLQLKIYQEGAQLEGAKHIDVTVDLQRGVYQVAGKAAKPLFSKEGKGIQDEEIFFLKNPKLKDQRKLHSYGLSGFKYGLVFTNGEKLNARVPDEINQRLFASMMILDDSYGIRTMQSENGCKEVVMRMRDTQKEGVGQITINQDIFDMPQAMKDNPKIKETQIILKIFVAFASFDVSKYMQDGLEPPIDFSNITGIPKITWEGVADTRGLINVRPRSADPGGWAAYHIPIIINRDGPKEEIPIINNNPDGAPEEKEEDF